MKKMISRLLTVALLGMSFAMTACTGDTSTSALSASNQDYDRTGNIQGKLIDATTGKAIAFDPTLYKSSDVEIILVRGTEDQTPSKYVFDNTKTLAGEYAFTGVPYTLGGNATYKLVVSIKGYQRFESEFKPQALWNSTAAAGAASVQGNNTNNTLDTVLNRIANIYLFPIGVNSVDYKARVMYNGKPVPAASVVLQQNAAANATTAEAQAGLAANLVNGAAVAASNNRLFPTVGLLPQLTGTTDADGYVTFAGKDLVLGGQYTITVLPFKSATFEGGVQLEKNVAGPIVVGNAQVTNTIQLASAEANAGYNTGSLYIAKTEPSLESNLLTSNAALSAGGVIKITFNRAVQLNDATSVNTYTAPVAATATTAAVAEGLNYVGYWATLTSTNSGFNTSMYSPAGSQPSGLTYPNYRGVIAADAVAGVFPLSVYTTAIAANKPVVASLDATKTVLTLTPQFVASFPFASYFDLKVTFSETSVPNTFGGANQQQKPTVSPEGHPEQRYSLFGGVAGATTVRFNEGSTLQNSVFVTGPRP